MWRQPVVVRSSIFSEGASLATLGNEPSVYRGIEPNDLERRIIRGNSREQHLSDQLFASSGSLPINERKLLPSVVRRCSRRRRCAIRQGPEPTSPSAPPTTLHPPLSMAALPNQRE